MITRFKDSLRGLIFSIFLLLSNLVLVELLFISKNAVHAIKFCAFSKYFNIFLQHKLNDTSGGFNYVAELCVLCVLYSVAAMHNPYANHNPAASAQNHVMGSSSGVPDVHKRDKDAIYG